MAQLGSRRVRYIDPGSPWKNGFVESFHGLFRDECLNREQLWTLSKARVVIEDFRQRYNHIRPPSKLGYQSPAHCAQQLTPSPAPVGLRQCRRFTFELSARMRPASPKTRKCVSIRPPVRWMSSPDMSIWETAMT